MKRMKWLLVVMLLADICIKLKELILGDNDNE